MKLLVFHFDGISAPLWSARHEADIEWWRLLAKGFGLDGIVMVDVTDDRKGRYYIHQDVDFHYEYHESLQTVVDAHPNLSFLCLEEREAALNQGIDDVHVMETFAFPEDDFALVVGSDLHGMTIPNVASVLAFERLPVDFAANAAVMALTLRHMRGE